MVYDYHLGKVVMFGGGTDQFVTEDDTWNGRTEQTWTQQFPAHSPSPRAATLAYDETAKLVVLFGGNTNGIAYDDTWTYNGVDWCSRIRRQCRQREQTMGWLTIWCSKKWCFLEVWQVLAKTAGRAG